jgi:hypothetical protein
MTYFYRQQQMAKGWGKEINAAWDDADHPRGKTTPESNEGSFRPKDGGGGGDVKAAPPDKAAPGGKYDPNYVDQDNWTRSNKQPSPAEMRQHGQQMGQLLRDRADNLAGADAAQQKYLDSVIADYGRDYGKQLNQRAVDEFNDAKLGNRTRAMDDAADLKVSMAYKPPGKVQVGAILSSSWGYDQTNVDFFEVTGMTKSGRTVTIRELAKIKTYDGDMTGKVRAIPGKYVGAPMTRRVTGGWIKVSGHQHGGLWDGTDKYFSEYA